MALCSRHPYVHVFKPLLILALEKFFTGPSLEVLQSLFDSINVLDISTLPILSLHEKQIMRGGNVTILFPDEVDNCLTGPSVMAKRLTRQLGTQPETKLIFDGYSYFWESKVHFDDVPVPVRIPLDLYAGEIGDVLTHNRSKTHIGIVVSDAICEHVSSSNSQDERTIGRDGDFTCDLEPKTNHISWVSNAGWRSRQICHGCVCVMYPLFERIREPGISIYMPS